MVTTMQILPYLVARLVHVEGAVFEGDTAPHNDPTIGTFVAVDVEVVRCREDGDQRGKPCCLTLTIHLVAVRTK